jgi:Fe-S cluster assembly protein SufD
MIAVKDEVKQQETYFARFAELEKRRAGKEPSWLQKIRKAAFERFAELGFPTIRNEEWKYTSVAPIARTPFRPSADYLAPVGVRRSKDLNEATFADCIPLHFYNGRIVDELIPSATLPAGVKVNSLAKALAASPAPLENYLARFVSYENQAFVALNTAFMEDGAYIEISKDVIVDKPIFINFVAGPSNEPIIYHPRNLIVVGQNSQATIFERYCSENACAEDLYLTNAVTEIIAGENASVEHIKEQDEGRKAFHIATVQIQQERSSSVNTTSLAFGSVMAREDVIAVLDGPGAECTLNGLYVTTGTQHVDNHTTIDHAKPHCSSRELYKGVLNGKSTAVFNGKIVVRKDAQKTDSKQSNKNLLLAEGCVINTKPQLEIYADDVKCTHGATIGQIDAEAIFYLRSRGIALDEARTMLTLAFANDVIGKIKSEPLRTRLQITLGENLAGKKESGAGTQESEREHYRISTLHER